MVLTRSSSKRSGLAASSQEASAKNLRKSTKKNQSPVVQTAALVLPHLAEACDQAAPGAWTPPSEQSFARVVKRIRELLPSDATKTSDALQTTAVQQHALCLLALLLDRATDKEFCVDSPLEDLYEGSTVPKQLQGVCEYAVKRVGCPDDLLALVDEAAPWWAWLDELVTTAQDRVTSNEELYESDEDIGDYVLMVPDDELWDPYLSDVVVNFLDDDYRCLALVKMCEACPDNMAEYRKEFQALCANE